VLPKGWIISGVVTWAMELHRFLRDAGRDPVILEHAPEPYHVPFEPPTELQAASIKCGYIATRGLEPAHVECYRQVLPATFVPNWGYETYAACAKLAGEAPDAVRVIGMCHSDDGQYYALLRHAEPIVHRFIAVSDVCAAKLTRLIPHRAADIVVRPYAVRVPPVLDRSYSAPGEPLRLLYAGRMDQNQKRVFDLPRLAARLSERSVHFQLRIVGEGTDKPELLQQVARLPAGVRDRINIEAGVPPDRIADLLRCHDVAVLVSAYEGTAVFMLEALAQGCVPVVTRVSGTATAIEHGVSGYSVPVGDLDAMADIIAGLAADRERLRQVGAAAYARAERFSCESYVKWFVQLVDDVWQEPPRQWPRHRPMFPLNYHIYRWGLAPFAIGPEKIRRWLGRRA
jgi:glycosyltransferase involved in cell wall biosynthesis